MSESSEMPAAWGACAPTLEQRAWVHAIRHAPPWLRRPLVRAFRRHVEKGWRGPVDVTVRGIRARCHVLDNAPEYKLVFQGRRFDRWHVRQLLPLLDADTTFVDIGANFGFFSLIVARQLGEKGRVLAIEPNPEMARRLRVNVALNEFKCITVVEAAVGGAEGWARRDPAVVDHGCAGYGDRDGTTSQASVCNPAERIRMRPLARVLKEAGLERVDVLKIDIEGYEDQALQPFFETAPESLWPRTIMMECAHNDHWKTDIFSRICEAGYRTIAQSRVDVVMQRAG